MLGKLIAHAPTRAEAIDKLATALDRLQLLGIPNNRRLLAACLRHPVFRDGQALIPFLAEHASAIRADLQQDERTALDTCAHAVLFPGGPARSLANPFTRPARLRHRGELIDYRLREFEVVAAHCSAVHLSDGRWHVQQGAVDLFLEDASFEPLATGPGGRGANELRAPFNGKVIAVKAAPGQPVVKGDTLLVIESMKLEHALAATHDAVVSAVHVQPGQQAATSQVLVSFQ